MMWPFQLSKKIAVGFVQTFLKVKLPDFIYRKFLAGALITIESSFMLKEINT